MRIKFVKDEDFVNYKQPCMFIGSIMCDFKCCVEGNIPVTTCQNEPWAYEPVIEIDTRKLIVRYLNNKLTQAVVFGGLEPFMQFEEILDFIRQLREDYKCNDPVIIYTGYYPEEVSDQLQKLKLWENIIVKFGRYIPTLPSRYDELLGVTLASENQFCQKLS